MQLTLTNNLGDPVPVMSTDEGGWAESLEPGLPLTLDHTGSDVVIVGDKPDVIEQIQQGVAVIGTVVRDLLTQIAGRRGATVPLDSVAVTIANHGEKAVRCILGDGTTDHDIQPGEIYDAGARGYIELRELGDVAVDPNQHEAA